MVDQLKNLEQEHAEMMLIQKCLQRDYERRRYILVMKMKKQNMPRVMEPRIMSGDEFSRVRYKQYDFFLQQLRQMCNACLFETYDQRHILLDNRDERHQDLEMALIHAEMFRRRIYFLEKKAEKKCSCSLFICNKN